MRKGRCCVLISSRQQRKRDIERGWGWVRGCWIKSTYLNSSINQIFLWCFDWSRSRSHYCGWMKGERETSDFNSLTFPPTFLSFNPIMTEASPTRSILISSPDSISISNHRLEFLTLPHPKSSIPTYFLPTSSTSTTTSTSSQHSQSKHDQSRSDYLEREQNCDEILELKVIRPEKGQRSWFVATTPKELQQDDDSEGKQQQQQQHESDFGQVIGGKLSLFQRCKEGREACQEPTTRWRWKIGTKSLELICP